MSRGSQGRRTRGRAGGRRPAEDGPSDGNWIEPEEAGCRLIVGLDARTPIEPCLAVDAVAAFFIEAGDAEAARLLIHEAHAAGRAVFLVDRVDLVRPLGADGVFLNRPTEVAAARRQLDQDTLIGAAVGTTRHDAMVAGEDGADYVLFGTPGAPPANGVEALVDHVAWWSEVAVLPSVAAGRFTADEVTALVAAGADFILPATDGGPAALRDIAAALGLAKAQQR